MASWQRTHTCGDLTVDQVGQEVVLNGWIENHRHHGGVVFVDLRDRYGVTQVVVNEDESGAEPKLLETVARLGAEDVLSIGGRVGRRDADKVNRKRSTGAIEVVALRVQVLNEAQTPPFEVLDDVEANEELRMRYRYLDLRRPSMALALTRRSNFVIAVRKYLASQKFLDVETPILTKSTPEGARDYLVPSRVSPGKFYALPQSPQIFKQLLMVAGLDRYYQVARCFRDEDLRADRQPEFTQIDLEMSFVEEPDVQDIVEGMMVAGFAEGFGIEVTRPFPRLSYDEAMRLYGSDKPDLRFRMPIRDVSELAAGCEFKVFTDAIAAGGAVRGLCVEGAGERFSRKDIDNFTRQIADYGARGLAWAKVTDGELTGSIAKFFGGDAGARLTTAMAAKPGDLLMFVADRNEIVQRSLGELRLRLGTALGLRDPKKYCFAWITEFPLFMRDPDRNAWDACHHPFTAPLDWQQTDFAQDTEAIRSRAYDLVLNGTELGSGSIRIHRPDVQARVFDFLGIREQEQKERFGFLLEALRYGAPPHGGIALGLDRTVAVAMGLDSIRDVVAFPKTTSASDLMCEAPSTVRAEQLADLHIVTLAPKG